MDLCTRSRMNGENNNSHVLLFPILPSSFFLSGPLQAEDTQSALPRGVSAKAGHEQVTVCCEGEGKEAISDPFHLVSVTAHTSPSPPPHICTLPLDMTCTILKSLRLRSITLVTRERSMHLQATTTSRSCLTNCFLREGDQSGKF